MVKYRDSGRAYRRQCSQHWPRATDRCHFGFFYLSLPGLFSVETRESIRLFFLFDSNRERNRTNADLEDKIRERRWPNVWPLGLHQWNKIRGAPLNLRQDPLDLSFWSFSTFLHYGIEEVERHLLWKFYKKNRRKSWSNVPPKVLTCIGFLNKVVHKIGRLRKFNRSREIEFNFFTAWTIFMTFGTLVQHAPGYKILPQIF